MPVKAVIPIQPYLVGPNSRESAPWFNKKFSFADEAGQYNLVMSVYILPSFVYNPKLVAAKEINAWKDLLAPKWKGKLVMRDPRLAGGGLAIATLWYVNPKLGKEFIQKIFTAQELALSRDDRQLLDFVGQGEISHRHRSERSVGKGMDRQGFAGAANESRSAARGRA